MNVLKLFYMAKNYFLKIFAGFALLGLLASCNTTSDPTESIPNPDEGAPPQKILSKVSVNASSEEEFVTTAGVLEKAVFKDEVNTNANYTGTVTYTNKKITNIKFVSTASTSMNYTFDITPDGKGNIYNASCVATSVNAGAAYVSDLAFTYDTAGKLTKVLEKRKVGGITAYNVFVENLFTYSGENIAQVTVSKGMLDINGTPNMATAVVSKYSFQNYDTQKSPYSTLPIPFFIIRGLISPGHLYKASPNNPTSKYFQLPSPAAPVNTAQTYSYDQQGYPLVEKNQNIVFTYKNL